jgi:hypothetical protein
MEKVKKKLKAFMVLAPQDAARFTCGLATCWFTNAAFLYVGAAARSSKDVSQLQS